MVKTYRDVDVEAKNNAFDSLKSNIGVWFATLAIISLLLMGFINLVNPGKGDSHDFSITMGYYYLLAGLILVGVIGILYFMSYKIQKSMLLKIYQNEIQSNPDTGTVEDKQYSEQMEFTIKKNTPQILSQLDLYYCSNCNITPEQVRNAEDQSTIIQVCTNCLTVCDKLITNCHTCGKEFTDFNESIREITKSHI